MEFLDLSNKGLTTLAPDFARTHADLEIAFFSNNPFREIPKVLGSCRRLRILGFKNCALEEINPEALPPSLEWLILTNNQLTELPDSLARLSRLRKLALAGNNLSSFPAELRECRNLELLRISANKLTVPPPRWLFSLPKLAWCAFAGNPCCERRENTQKECRSVEWRELMLEAKLGESPSSEVFRATLKDSQEKVAVKVYRAEMTSDGWPEDDLAASLLAGRHPNLVSTLGKVEGHPEGREAVALELLGEGYRQVGKPPSFDTCTRDTFTEQQRYRLKVIAESAQSIATALTHLHSQGILHGDVYAHNALMTPTGATKLGDFGAATVLGRVALSEEAHKAAELVEVRAFGCYLEDILTLAAKDETHQPGRGKKLWQLAKACLSESPASRPTFAELTSCFIQS